MFVGRGVLPPPWKLYFAIVFLFPKRLSSLSSQSCQPKWSSQAGPNRKFKLFLPNQSSQESLELLFQAVGTDFAQSRMLRAPVCQSASIVTKTSVLLYQNAHWRFCAFGRHLQKTGAKGRCVAFGYAFAIVSRSDAFGSFLTHHPGGLAAFQASWGWPGCVPEVPWSVPRASWSLW